MSLNGRLKARAASFARTAYPPILGSLRRVLSERQLQRFILVCDRLKGWLLKEAVVVPSPSPMALPPWIVDEMKALARIEACPVSLGGEAARFHFLEGPDR